MSRKLLGGYAKQLFFGSFNTLAGAANALRGSFVLANGRVAVIESIQIIIHGAVGPTNNSILYLRDAATGGVIARFFVRTTTEAYNLYPDYFVPTSGTLEIYTGNAGAPNPFYSEWYIGILTT